MYDYTAYEYPIDTEKENCKLCITIRRSAEGDDAHVTYAFYYDIFIIQTGTVAYPGDYDDNKICERVVKSFNSDLKYMKF